MIQILSNFCLIQGSLDYTIYENVTRKSKSMSIFYFTVHVSVLAISYRNVMILFL
jgi:hypothetical protein